MKKNNVFVPALDMVAVADAQAEQDSLVGVSANNQNRSRVPAGGDDFDFVAENAPDDEPQSSSWLSWIP